MDAAAPYGERATFGIMLSPNWLSEFIRSEIRVTNCRLEKQRVDAWCRIHCHQCGARDDGHTVEF